MRYRDILIPIVCAIGGFAVGWYAHRKVATDRTAEAIKQTSNMYKEKLKEADDILNSVDFSEALALKAEAKQKEAVERVKNWRDSLAPGYFTYDEYDDLFKTPAPDEILKETEASDKKEEPKKNETDNFIGEEEEVLRPRMDWHGDPIDDDILYENSTDEDYIPQEPDEAEYQLNVDYPIFYIRPEEVGEIFGYQEVNLVVYQDGIVTDDAGALIPLDEVPDMIGEGYADHFGEYADEALWAVNRRNKTYYEVLLDGRTYRETIGRGEL